MSQKWKVRQTRLDLINFRLLGRFSGRTAPTWHHFRPPYFLTPSIPTENSINTTHSNKHTAWSKLHNFKKFQKWLFLILLLEFSSVLHLNPSVQNDRTAAFLHLFNSVCLSVRHTRIAFLRNGIFERNSNKRLQGICNYAISLWSITAKNTDCSAGPLACPFARSLAPLTRLLAPDCSLRSRPPLRSLIRSLAHFTHSLARGTVIY